MDLFILDCVYPPITIALFQEVIRLFPKNVKYQMLNVQYSQVHLLSQLHNFLSYNLVRFELMFNLFASMHYRRVIAAAH